MGGANNNQVSTFDYLMILILKASSTKGAFSSVFIWIVCSDLSRQMHSPFSLNWQILRKFFLVKFQASILDESHPLRVKVSCKSPFQNLDVLSARSAVCLLQPILQLSLWPPLWLRFFEFTCFWCTPTHFQSNPSSDFALDTDSRSWSTKLAHLRRGCYLILEQLVDVCSW